VFRHTSAARFRIVEVSRDSPLSPPPSPISPSVSEMVVLPPLQNVGYSGHGVSAARVTRHTTSLLLDSEDLALERLELVKTRTQHVFPTDKAGTPTPNYSLSC
jgi:hypothetical protein